MQLWTGVDAVEVARIAKSMTHKGFVERYFSVEERGYFVAHNHCPQTVAGHFAAKEAFAKAMGTGVRGFGMKEVGIIYDPLGQPSYHLTGGAKALCGARKLSLSITHTHQLAIAFAVAWEG